MKRQEFSIPSYILGKNDQIRPSHTVAGWFWIPFQRPVKLACLGESLTEQLIVREILVSEDLLYLSLGD